MLADPEQTIYLADMSGDGLSDLVRVRNGEVCYWPNIGFGRFGAKVTMDCCPWLDEPDHFDQRRVRLADVDGSGAADLIYLHPDGTRLYLNQSGNGFSEPHTLPHGFPRPDSLARRHGGRPARPGHRLPGLVLAAARRRRPAAALPRPDGRGQAVPAHRDRTTTWVRETRISYAPSTRFYLADQAAGRPWVTRLPFPVQVVERVETIDRINHNRFTTRYAYHHGYFDGFEREFRGFGMVEQLGHRGTRRARGRRCRATSRTWTRPRTCRRC